MCAPTSQFLNISIPEAASNLNFCALPDSLYVLRQEVKQLRQEIGFHRHLNDMLGDQLNDWVTSFESALKRRGKDIEVDSEFVAKIEEQFIDLLEEILVDPISGKALNEEAVLGNDGYTYNQESLQYFWKGVTSEYKNRSPLHPENPVPFITSAQPILKILLDCLNRRKVNFPQSEKKAIAKFFLASAGTKPILRLYMSPLSLQSELSVPSREPKKEVEEFRAKTHGAFGSSFASASLSQPIAEELRIDVLRRQIFAELTTIERPLKQNSYLETECPDLSRGIQNWSRRFRERLSDVRNRDNPFYLRELLTENVCLLKRLLGDYKVQERNFSTFPFTPPILKPLFSFLQKRDVDQLKTPSNQLTYAQRIERIRKQKEAREQAKHALEKEAQLRIEEIKQEVAQDVTSRVATDFAMHIAPHFNSMKLATAAAAASIARLSEEDQRELFFLESELIFLEADIALLNARNEEIEQELIALEGKISEAEMENLMLEKEINLLKISAQKLRRKQKEQIWTSILSIGGCMLASYCLSYTFNAAMAVVPTGQGTGAAFHMRFAV